MKLQHIRQSLNAIKETDLINLEELKDKIKNLERELDIKYTELEQIKIRKEIIDNIFSIRESKKSLMRFLRPLLELVLLAIISYIIIISAASMSGILIVFAGLLLAVSLDALHILKDDYTKVIGKDDISCRGVLKALSNIFKSKNILSLDMEECLALEEDLNSDIKELEKELNLSRAKSDSLKDEISYIEGNEHAVNCMIDKYKLEEMNNETAVVQFIERKIELKKTMEPANSY